MNCLAVKGKRGIVGNSTQFAQLLNLCYKSNNVNELSDPDQTHNSFINEIYRPWFRGMKTSNPLTP